jgi:hypothetical protein
MYEERVNPRISDGECSLLWREMLDSGIIPMRISAAVFWCLACFAQPLPAADAALKSVLTPLSGKLCAAIGKADKETGASVEKCPGVGGVELRVAYDDQRMSISLVLEGGNEQPLDLWSVVTRAFSSLGRQAEWRVRRGTTGKLEPFALIVRVNDNGAKKTYLAVAKIEAQRACVVDVIAGASGDANRRARESADRAASKPCLEGK